MAVTVGRDHRGGECRIETGVGRITEVKPAEVNWRVFINSDNKAMVESVTGWIDGLGPTKTLIDQLRALPFMGVGRQVRYRVDVVRKPSVDVAIPFADLDKRQKTRDLVELEFLEVTTDQSDDGPPSGGSAPVPVPVPTPITDRLSAAIELARGAARCAAGAAMFVPERPEAARFERAQELLNRLASDMERSDG